MKLKFKGTYDCFKASFPEKRVKLEIHVLVGPRFVRAPNEEGILCERPGIQFNFTFLKKIWQSSYENMCLLLNLI